MLEKVRCCICFTIIVSTSCSGNAVSGDEKLYYLDLDRPSIVQPIDPKYETLEGYKFVQVEVAEVVNPQKHPITFQVHYQTKTNDKLYLGSFSLYPPDNPGKFIVATQGKLRNEGAIVVSLSIRDKVDARDTVRVGVKRIKFVKA